MNAIEQYFYVVLFIMLDKVVLTFKYVKSVHFVGSNLSLWMNLLPVTIL